MQNSNKKIFDNLVSRTKIYLVIIFILLAVICSLNIKFIIPSILLFFLIGGYTYFTNNKRKSEISETLQDLTLTVDSAAKTSLINSPFPLIIIETDGNIVWKSVKFASEFEDVDMNAFINDLVFDLQDEIKNKKEKNDKSILRRIQVNKKTYKLVGKFVNSKKYSKNNKKEYMAILYFIDETENVKLQKEYNDSKSCVGIIMIDNYEENMQMLESEEKTQYIADIDKCIYEWTNETNGILIKSDRDRYIYIFEQRYLDKIKEDKFSVLDKIKELDPKQKVQFTLSIAISNEGKVDKEKYKSAQTAMDIVLGRGGDQAVVRQNDIYKFFGGRAQEVEKRTKVKARVVAHALENLIRESSKVMVMGHSNPDIDSMGSSIGIYALAKSLDKNAYIITSDTPTLHNFKDSLLEEPEYEDVLISKEVAEENIDEDTLLVIVDTHKFNYVESEETLKKARKIVIIDHHRRSADYIENATLTFQEVYASSAAELVTELLQYAEVNVDLKKIEAESLYAGIMMDTKSFTFKTGVRTFEAAAYLRKCGVDIIKVKKWFQSDLESFNKIAEIVKSAEIVNDTIAIAMYNQEKAKDVSLLCAKAADELLTIGDVTASFVLGNTGEKICISGRSIGDINVQVILEKLGGGGHITLAGAQVEGMSAEEVKEELIVRINEYFSEIEN
ncbi:MAG: DHH family phosphoesterase [Clostridia bacterium]|nr:DHH family phosphoesterase [Clostridia bacterium]